MNRNQAIFIFFAALSLLCTPAHGQDMPAVTPPPTNQGFSLPDPLTGGFRFGLTASQNLQTGFNGSQGNLYVTALSGDAAYLNLSTAKPFSMVYSGGYLYTGGQHAYNYIPSSSTFQNLAISQGLKRKLWSLTLEDSLHYLPEAPTLGLSGIAGLGDIGLTPPPIGGTGQDILSLFGQRVDNTSQVTLERKLTAGTAVQATGSYTLEKFVDNSGGLDNNSVDGGGAVNHRLNALSSVGGSYDYSRFSYPSLDYSFVSQSFQARYNRRFNRKLSMLAEAGPIRTSSNVPGAGPTSWDVGANLGLRYAGEMSGIALEFYRGVRGGSGIVLGVVATGVDVTATHKLGRQANVSGSLGYTQNDNTSLSRSSFSAKTFLSSIQFTRALSRDFSMFASYSVEKQSISGVATSLTGFDGVTQIVAGGVTYAPRLINLGRK